MIVQMNKVPTWHLVLDDHLKCHQVIFSFSLSYAMFQLFWNVCLRAPWNTLVCNNGTTEILGVTSGQVVIFSKLSMQLFCFALKVQFAPRPEKSHDVPPKGFYFPCLIFSTTYMRSEYASHFIMNRSWNILCWNVRGTNSQ